MVCPDGTTYARGTMYHEPDIINDLRPADHARVKLADKTWHLVVRNTVPRQRQDGPRTPDLRVPRPRRHRPRRRANDALP